MKQHIRDFTRKWPDMQRSQCISSQFAIPAALVNTILEAAFESEDAQACPTQLFVATLPRLNNSHKQA